MVSCTCNLTMSLLYLKEKSWLLIFNFLVLNLDLQTYVGLLHACFTYKSPKYNFC